MRKTLLALLFVAFAVPVVAQQQYGRLEGDALDAQGLALPGVSVTLSGEAIIATRNATTDVDGSYRFQALPPGDYLLQFELSGFQTVLFEDIRVVTGATFSVDANMQIATVAEDGHRDRRIAGGGRQVHRSGGDLRQDPTRRSADGHRHVGGAAPEPWHPGAGI